MYEMLSQNTGKYLPRSFSLCVGVAHVACLHVRVCVGVCVCALEKHLTLPCPSKKTKLCEINVRGYGVNVAFIQNGYRATGAGAEAEAGEALAQRTKASNVIKNKLNGKCKRKRRTQQSDLQTDRQTNRQIDGQSDRQTGSEARRMCHGFHCSLNTHSFHGATDAVAVALAVAVAHTKAAQSRAQQRNCVKDLPAWLAGAAASSHSVCVRKQQKDTTTHQHTDTPTHTHTQRTQSAPTQRQVKGAAKISGQSKPHTEKIKTTRTPKRRCLSTCAFVNVCVCVCVSVCLSVICMPMCLCVVCYFLL